MSFTIRKKLENVCPKSVVITLSDDHVVENVFFDGGCQGNHKAINMLLTGQKLENFIQLEGITCGTRDTSCSAEIVKAIKESLED